MNQETPAQPALWRRLGPTGLLGLLWTAMPAICGVLLLAYLGPISEWLREDPSRGLVIYVSVFILSAGFGLLPTYAQALLGGWVFGMWLGFVAALVGFTGAAIIGYTIARCVSRDRVEELIERNAKAQVVRDSLIHRGLVRTMLIVALLRVPPNSPFALTNLAMASVGVSRIPYVLGTALGMAPRTFLAAFIAAAGAATGSRDLQTLVREAGWPIVIVSIAGMIVALTVIGIIANRAIEQLNRNRPVPIEPAAKV